MFPLRLRIRSLIPDDLDAIHEIDRLCFPPDIAFSRREIEGYLHDSGSIGLAAEGRKGMAGFVLARVENGPAAHVLTLDILPEMRRCGIGTQLMDALHRRLQKSGIRTAILEVSVQNLAAQRLYQKLGYEICGLLPGYYQNRGDAYPMKREVQS